MKRLLSLLIFILFAVNPLIAQNDYNNPPSWDYLQQFGGDGADRISDSAVSSDGSLFIAGYFNGPTLLGEQQMDADGIWNAFVAKVDASDGTVHWHKTITGQGIRSQLTGIKLDIDGSNNVYVAGNIVTADGLNSGAISSPADIVAGFFMTGFTEQGEELFVKLHETAEYNLTSSSLREFAAADNYLYMVLDEGSVGHAFVFDNEGNYENRIDTDLDFSYVATDGNSVSWIVATAYATTLLGVPIEHTGPFSPTSVINTNLEATEGNWSNYVGQTLSSALNLGAIEVNSDGEVFVCGIFEGLLNLNDGQGQLGSGERNAVTAKLSPDGVLLWAVAPDYDGFGEPAPRDLAINEDGKVAVRVTSLDPGFEYNGNFLGRNGLVLLAAEDGSLVHTKGNDYEFQLLDYTQGNIFTNNTEALLVDLESTTDSFADNWNWAGGGNSGFARPVGGLATDSQNNIYTYGIYNGAFPNVPSAADNSLILNKFNADGQLQASFSAIAYGSFDISYYGSQIAIDEQDYIVFGGDISGSLQFPDGSFIENTNGSSFIAKVNTNLELQWIKQFSSEEVQSISCGPNNSIVVSGVFDNLFSFAYGSTELDSPQGLADFYLMKLDANGDLQWVKSAGGEDVEFTALSGIDAEGNVYMAGEYVSKSIVIDGTSVEVGTDDSQAALSKFDPNGNHLWTKAFGSGSLAGYWPTGFQTDEEGNCHVIGWFSSGLEVAGESYEHPNADVTNIFHNYVAKFNPDGDPLWFNPIYQSEFDFIGIQPAIDAEGNVYFSGRYRDQADFGDEHTMLSEFQSRNLYFAKYSNEGELIWVKAADNQSGGFASGYAAAVNGNKTIYSGYVHTVMDFSGQTLSAASNNGFIGQIDNGIDVGIETPAESITLNVFPNPTSNHCALSIKTEARLDVQIEIYDAKGALVQSREMGELAKGQYDISINTANWASGLYLIQAVTERGIFETKLTKF